MAEDNTEAEDTTEDIVHDAEVIFSHPKSAEQFMSLLDRLGHDKTEVPGKYCRRAIRTAAYVLRESYKQAQGDTNG